MDILLDTHAAIWFFEDDERLSKPAAKAICNLGNMIFISVASLWEVAIKQSTGKLVFDDGFDGFLNAINMNDFVLLKIKPEHVKATMNLPLVHRDPFDRMLIAQAVTEGMSIMTIDANILQYDVKSVW